VKLSMLGNKNLSENVTAGVDAYKVWIRNNSASEVDEENSQPVIVTCYALIILIK